MLIEVEGSSERKKGKQRSIVDFQETISFQGKKLEWMQFTFK